MKKSILLALMLSSLPLSQAFASSNDVTLSKEATQCDNNVVSFSTVYQEEVKQNYLTVTLSYSVSGENGEMVQKEVSEKINHALEVAKFAEKGDELKVKSGDFRISPKYNNSMGIIGQIGSGSIIIEGTNFPLIQKTISEIKGLTISNISTSVSPDLIKKKKAQITEGAIKNFKEEAAETAKLFGFDSYKIRSLSINYEQQNVYPVARGGVMMMKGAMAESSPATNTELNVETGSQTISTVISGSIVLGNAISH